MPVCPWCPGRSFKDDQALRQHRESGVHPTSFTCQQCGKVLQSQQALQQHINAKHPSMYECRYCDREFATENGRSCHEDAKHPSMYECRYCDREFTTEYGRSYHEDAKHSSMYECNYCDRRFSTDQGRISHQVDAHLECHFCDRSFNCEAGRRQHEEAKHPQMFECNYCNREFSSEEALKQHQDAKHTFECNYCDRAFWTENDRQGHETTEHLTCCHCNRSFGSESGRLQHEASAHNFKCELCYEVFTQADSLQCHKQYGHIKCRFCTNEFGTRSSKNAHERSCTHNPATLVKRATTTPDPPTSKSSPPSFKEQYTTESDEGSSTPDVALHADDPSASPASSLHSSNSTLDEGETFHSTGGISAADEIGDGATIEDPCTPVCPHEPSTCLGSEQTSPDEHLPDDVEDAVFPDAPHQDHIPDCRDIIFTCTACLDVFSTEEAYRGHICAYRTAMLTPHCTICYSQFDDESLLQQHLEGVEAFSCQLCQTRCCSEEMMQDHLLSHPTCTKCGESFANDLVLCAHVESDHPVVVCWDCDGVVVEKDNLGLHYTESSAHPSCVFCGVGTKNPEAMDEHVRDLHSSVAEMPIQLGGGNVSPDETSLITENVPPQDQDASGPPSEQPDSVPPPPVMEPIVPLGGPCDAAHNSPSRTESSLFLSPQPPMPAQVEHISNSAKEPCIADGEVSLHVNARQYSSPSPTPSEDGSDIIQVRVHATGVINAAVNDDTRPSSPASTVSVDSSLSDTNQTTSSHSVVFVSADGLPDYIRENRAVLVATSAGSPSSGRTPLRLPSSSSLESLDMVQRIQRIQARCEEQSTNAGGVARPTHWLHCRICLKDPCEEMTATICGHLFCKRCITQAVVAKSECPVCKSATLLYCLFKLDLSA